MTYLDNFFSLSCPSALIKTKLYIFRLKEPFKCLAFYHCSVQFYGCMPYNDTVDCCADTTLDATNASEYRHFSVDTDKFIIYFCDYKSYEEGLYCYYTKRDASNPTLNEWTELPRYITYIVGYSKSTGKPLQVLSLLMNNQMCHGLLKVHTQLRLNVIVVLSVP